MGTIKFGFSMHSLLVTTLKPAHSLCNDISTTKSNVRSFLEKHVSPKADVSLLSLTIGRFLSLYNNSFSCKLEQLLKKTGWGCIVRVVPAIVLILYLLSPLVSLPDFSRPFPSTSISLNFPSISLHKIQYRIFRSDLLFCCRMP